VHNFLLRTWGYSGCTLHTYFSNSVEILENWILNCQAFYSEINK
jgi:hypothetical protein